MRGVLKREIFHDLNSFAFLILFLFFISIADFILLFEVFIVYFLFRYFYPFHVSRRNYFYIYLLNKFYS